MQRRLRPLILLLIPLLCVTIFCAAQVGLLVVRPERLDIGIGPQKTANYEPWITVQFKPVDPALGTLISQEEGGPTLAPTIPRTSTSVTTDATGGGTPANPQPVLATAQRPADRTATARALATSSSQLRPTSSGTLTATVTGTLSKTPTG